MTTYRLLVFVCSIFLVIPGAAIGERLPLKPYTVADGLAHNEINKIVRDSRGFLWFCTAEGLSRFDGYEFTNFGPDQGMPHRTINDFLETNSGELWVATNGGLVRFDPTGTPINRIVYANDVNSSDRPMFSVVVPEDQDRLVRAVTVLRERRDGTIWIGTRKGLFSLQRLNGHFNLRPIELKTPLNHQPFIYDMVEDRHGSLWLATAGGLNRIWPDGSTASYWQGKEMPDYEIQDVLEDERGRLWAGTRNAGIFRFTSDETHAPPVVEQIYSVRDGLASRWVNQIFETSDKRFWVATDKGVDEFFPEALPNENKFKSYNQRNGLLYWGVNTLNEDTAGNLWIGSDAGAMKLAHDGFITYGAEDGLMAVYAIFQDRTGNTCFRASVFGDQQATVFEGAKADLLHPLDTFHPRYGKFDGRRFTWLKPDILTRDDLGWVGEAVTLQTHNGEWWLGTGQGIYRFPVFDDFTELKNTRPIAVYTTKDGLKAQQVFRLFEDSSDRIWVSTIQPNGLAYWERRDATWHDLTDAAGLPSSVEELARSFVEDNAQNIWVGFNTGVARYRDGHFDFFTSADGVPPGAVMNAHKDHAGRLWFTSARGGLIRLDHPEVDHPAFVSYTTAEGLSSNSTEALTEDTTGRIYVSTGRGLDRLDPSTGRFKHFTTADGLVDGPMRAAFRDPYGTLWFGTGKGLSRLFPGTEHLSAPPPVMITGLSVVGENQHVSALGESVASLRDLKSNENQLQISFVGLSFEPGEELRYQYKLAGSTEGWGLPNQQRTVTLASLAPGRYEFLVRALNSDGVPSTVPARLSFVIMPPIWQRWWFIALAVIAFALVGIAAYRYRIRRLLEVANMRTRIATDLHDDIGANLTKIAILSEVAKQQIGDDENGKAANPLSAIARISRESVASMSDIVWAINPDRDHMLDLVRRMRQHAEEVFTSRNIKLAFTAPPTDQNLKLGSDMRRDLLLIFKEAVNNAARHSGCSKVEINCRTSGSSLVLQVADDGGGFDQSEESDGEGLTSMRRRAERLGGTFDLNSKQSTGTTVEVRIPHVR